MSKKGTPSWNKGLKLSKIPRYASMGFQKGHPRFTQALHAFTSDDVVKSHRIAKANGTQGGQGTKRPHMSGPNHFAWVADRTKLVRRNRSEPEYIEWRTQVFKRDGYKCKISNKDCDGDLEAHHILSWADFVELRYEINNGITLCHSHHPRGRAADLMVTAFQRLVATSH